MERIKNYCLNSSLHGIRYIAEPDSHWTERFFWLVCCLVSWTVAVKIIFESLSQYQFGSISFVVETTFLRWDTEFPSVTVCQREDFVRAEEYAKSRINNVTEDDLLPLGVVLNEIAFFTGKASEIKDFCEDLACPTENMRDVSDQIRGTCQDLFHHCEWNGKPFSCCKYFLPVETELGPCFVTNNIQATNFSRKTKYPMISNITTGPGTLKLKVKSRSYVYLMSQEDVPTINTKVTTPYNVDLSKRRTMRFYIADVMNEPEVKGVSIEQRKCRFPKENYIDIYPYYSYTSCIVMCHKKAQLEKCNCTTHLMPGTKKHEFCDLAGLRCLDEHKEVLRQLIDVWENEQLGLPCDCLQSCDESDITVFYQKSSDIPNGNGFGEVEIIMDHLPSERFIRKVVRDKLDMVVSTGSTIGLFLGASLLSLVEFIHYFVLPCFERKKPDSPPQNEQPQPLVITHRRFARLEHELAKRKNQRPKISNINIIHVK